MARPRLGESERRARTIGVRVTEAEAAELRERAQAARLSMGAYLRRRALGQRVRIAAELRLGEGRLDKAPQGVCQPCCLRRAILVIRGHALPCQFSRAADLGAGHVTFKIVPHLPGKFVPVCASDVPPHVR